MNKVTKKKEKGHKVGDGGSYENNWYDLIVMLAMCSIKGEDELSQFLEGRAVF